MDKNPSKCLICGKCFAIASSLRGHCDFASYCTWNWGCILASVVQLPGCKMSRCTMTNLVLVLLCCFVVYSTRRLFLCLTLCHFVLVFFSPFSIAITSLGEEIASLCVFRTFVWFVLVCICRFPPALGVWEGLQFVIVALPVHTGWIRPWFMLEIYTYRVYHFEYGRAIRSLQ